MRALIFLAGFALLSALPSGSSEAAKLDDTCDGFAALRCEEGLWCEHPAGECQVADGSGTCVEVSGPFCPHISEPVCACGGVQYSNDCKRQRAKVQLDYVGECEK